MLGLALALLLSVSAFANSAADIIKATGVKMVLSGEGADELYGGYMYFHNCPNNTEFYFFKSKRSCSS